MFKDDGVECSDVCASQASTQIPIAGLDRPSGRPAKGKANSATTFTGAKDDSGGYLPSRGSDSTEGSQKWCLEIHEPRVTFLLSRSRSGCGSHFCESSFRRLRHHAVDVGRHLVGQSPRPPLAISRSSPHSTNQAGALDGLAFRRIRRLGRRRQDALGRRSAYRCIDK